MATGDKEMRGYTNKFRLQAWHTENYDVVLYGSGGSLHTLQITNLAEGTHSRRSFFGHQPAVDFAERLYGELSDEEAAGYARTAFV